jgi:sugar phosphate isomerase/epimerase
MATTYTGPFAIGFRRFRGDWQKDTDALIRWAREHEFEAIDVGFVPKEEIKQIIDGGLQIGSVDLMPWNALCVPDPGKRKESIAILAEYVKSVAPLGAKIFFSLAVTEEGSRDPKASFGYLIDGYAQLGAAIAGVGGKIVIEGLPGTLVATPAEFRLLFKEAGAPNVGVNFDPSHLIRMGIDPVRFLEEFAPRVFHTHAKDTEILNDEQYDFGITQWNHFAKPHAAGGFYWRYTIPGHGIARWGKLFNQLKAAGYKGIVSVELEDEKFWFSDENQQRGLLASRDFLKYV